VSLKMSLYFLKYAKVSGEVKRLIGISYERQQISPAVKLQEIVNRHIMRFAIKISHANLHI